MRDSITAQHVVASFKFGALTVVLTDEDAGRCPWGVKKWHNIVYLRDEQVYEDWTFRPSPMYKNLKDILLALVDFYVIDAEATDREVIENRNCPILDAYSQSGDAECLRGLIAMEGKAIKELKKHHITLH